MLMPRFCRHPDNLEVRAADQSADANESARREMTVEVRSIDGVEPVVQLQIGAVDGDRDEIVHV